MNEMIIGITHAESLAAESLLHAITALEIDSDNIRLFSNPDSAGNRLAYADHYIVTQDQSKADFSDCSLMIQLNEDTALTEKLKNADVVLLKQGGNQCFYAEDVDAYLDQVSTTYELVDSDVYILLKTLKLIQQQAEITNLQVSVLKPASQFDKKGIDELAKQTVDLLNARPVQPQVFSEQLAFNLIPISNQEASPIQFEQQLTHNLGQSIESVQAQMLQVPVFYGVCLLVTLQCDQMVSESLLAEDFSSLYGVRFETDDLKLITPVNDLKDESLMTISQLKIDEQKGQSIQYIITADEMKHGTAELFLNSISIIRKTFL